MRIPVYLGVCLWFGVAVRAQSLPDTDGRPVDAHGAGVLYYNGVYYLYGEIKKGPTRLVPNQAWEDYRVDAGGVSCYSSRDLVHWKNEGVALAAVRDDTASDLSVGRVIERPKVIYNARTKKFVLWMHIDRDDYSAARAGVAESDRPQGPYRYLGSIRPNGNMSRDMTVFKDDDGRAYLVYSSENNNTMQVCLLTPDYLGVTAVYKRILIGGRREAPAVFRNQGHYYLITSLCSGWDPNAARYAVADSMLGNWRQQGNPCVGRDSAVTFHAQSSFVLPVGGGRYVFMADRWNKTDLEHSDYLWLPLRVVNGRVEIRDTGEVSKRMACRPLSLVSYSMRVMATSSCTSFIRFFGAGGLLLEYRADVENGHTGNYTEAPPGTRTLEVGVRAAGWVEADSIQLETEVGEKKAVHRPLCDVGAYLRPFWQTDTVDNETVLLDSGRLLYEPEKVLSIRNYALDTVFVPGVDYRMEGRRIVRLPRSKMSYCDVFDKRDLAWYNLQSKWVVVTYTHHDRWQGPVPEYEGKKLPRFEGRLREGKPVTVVFYGMSITRGMDVSGYDGVAPYMPTYAGLFERGLRARYPRASVRLYNAGLPGSTVAWGAQNASAYVNPLHPDLVVVDFGMNDFWRMTPVEFGDSVLRLLQKVRVGCPGVEFMLLANMKFDPAYVADTDRRRDLYMSNLAGYAGELHKLEGPGVVCLDMTAISDLLYRRKKAKDCVVNPLHPNDYLARWYAQGMLALVLP